MKQALAKRWKVHLMAELARLNVAEALATRDYPIILRDRTSVLSDGAMRGLVGVALFLSLAVYLTASFWFGATRLQLHVLELGGLVVWGAIYFGLSELRREHVLELTATGMTARQHAATQPTAIAWEDILSISVEGDDIILRRRGAPPYQQALLRGLFGLTPASGGHFGASLSDNCALLVTHHDVNTAGRLR